MGRSPDAVRLVCSCRKSAAFPFACRKEAAMPFAYFCLALSMLLVGGNIAIGKLVLEELPVYLFALLRFLIASLVLLPGLALPRVRAGLDGGACRGLFLQAFFGCFLFSLCMLHGVQLTSATSAGIITSATPSVIALLAWLWLRERLEPRGLLAIALAVLGIAALNLLERPAGGRSGVVLWGGGSPKNFMLQTEPQIQEVLRIKEVGQDFFIQVTDARPDTGGLSGATPSEAVSWGKVDPTKLPDAVVCYTDTTIAMPLLTHYALAKHKPRKLKRLYDQRGKLMKALTKEYFQHNKVKMIDGSEPVLD